MVEQSHQDLGSVLLGLLTTSQLSQVLSLSTDFFVSTMGPAAQDGFEG